MMFKIDNIVSQFNAYKRKIKWVKIYVDVLKNNRFVLFDRSNRINSIFYNNLARHQVTMITYLVTSSFVRKTKCS